MPSDVTGIGAYAFSGCSSLTSIEIPTGVTSIGEYAFGGCSGLTGLDIPSGVTSIGSDAFYHCENLTSLIIPDSVTSIGARAFVGCDKLTDIQFPNEMKKCGSQATFEFADGVLNIKGTGEVTSAPWSGLPSIKTVVIEQGITNIYSNSFYDCVNLRSVTIPDSVVTIADCAFCGCEALTSVDIPVNVTSIGEYAFCGTNITSVVLPDSLKDIGEAAFKFCWSLSSVVLPNGITSIPNSMFESCDSLTSISIPDSVTSIEEWAFYRCSSLTSIIIPDSVTSIGDEAFAGCSSLTDVTILSRNARIDSDIFKNVSSVTIKGYSGSTAEEYADKNGYTFIDLEDAGSKKSQTLSGKVKYTKTKTDKVFALDVKLTVGDGALTYSSSDAKVATVSSKGLVTIKGTGKATITVMAEETSTYKSAQYTVTIVVNKPDTGNTDKDNTNNGSTTKVTLKAPAVKVSNTANGVKVTWTKISNATGYIVYRKASGAKNWTQLAKITKNSTVSYTDKTAAAGKTYTYAVKAYKGSVYSSIKTATIARVKTPTKVTLSNAANGVKVKWTKTSGVKGYIVYRKAKGAKSWTKVKTITKASTVSFVDTRAKSGKVYYYQVKAYGKSGGKTVYGAAKTGKAICYLKAPTKVSVAKKRAGIKVTWTKTAGAKGYIVYRKVKGSGKWVKIKTVKSPKTVTYLDKKVKKGKTYTYRVKAYYGSSYSAVKTSKTVKR